MKNCPNCNVENVDTSAFCVSCGTKLDVAEPVAAPVVEPVAPPTPVAAPVYQPPYPVYQQPQITEDMLPHELKPVSAGEFFGYSLLFSIPLVGFIMLFVVAFGSNYKKSLRNYAKLYLILMLVGVAISVVIMLIGIFAGGAAFLGGMDYYY